MAAWLALLYLALGSLCPTARAQKPNILFILADDFGWADAGWHREAGYRDVQTPVMDGLVSQGIQLDRQYVYQFCSPSRCAFQSGRNPIHVNNVNADPTVWNAKDPVSGFAGMPRNMTGVASVMRQAGYSTHFAGKWDVGMATPDHTPQGRGYDSSHLYFWHCVDYWTNTPSTGCVDPATNKTMPVVDLWDGAGPSSLNGSGTCGGPDQRFAACDCSTCAHCIGTGTRLLMGPFEGERYVDDTFRDRMVSTIMDHNTTDPLFLVWAPHIVHTPLQVPQAQLEKFAFIDRKSRQIYHAMVNYADGLIGDVVGALKEKGLYDNTLIVFSADNGGPLYFGGDAGANNYPLKGGKFSNWEGGIRVNSWVSGGFVPPARRGMSLDGYITVWDWYSTFAHLGGVDPTDKRAAAAGLPPIDSINQWPYLSGQVETSPRTEIPLGSPTPGVINGLIQGDYKLILGKQTSSSWSGPQFPNSSSTATPATVSEDCGTEGCLFDIRSDATEHNNLAKTMPALGAKLRARIAEIGKTVFSPDRGTDNGAACHAALQRGQYWGPFLP